MKYYVIEMSNGNRYGIPAEVIAKNYAKYCSENYFEDYEDNFNTMMYWFDTNDFEFADWAKGNMNWIDVKEHAVLLEKGTKEEVDFQEDWVNGDYRYVTMEEV